MAGCLKISLYQVRLVARWPQNQLLQHMECRHGIARLHYMLANQCVNKSSRGVQLL